MGQPTNRSVLSAARAACRVLLDRVEAEYGVRPESINQAIEEGYLSDLDWCAELSDHREKYGVRGGS